MAMKFETKGICGHVYHISWPHCPVCYEAEDTVCKCCGTKLRRYVLTEEGKRARGNAIMPDAPQQEVRQ